MSFLQTIWGDLEGQRCVVSGKMHQKFFSDNNVKIPSGKDVWFAPSIFSEGKRKIENVIGTKAFWLDIDCGKPGAYDTILDAATALKAFIEECDLPEPTIVRSGNGLHVYWILDRHVEPEKWHRIARAIREACVAKNLLADHGITIDIARILRVPGTKNYKDPNKLKDVELLTEITSTTYQILEGVLSNFIFQQELKADAKKRNDVFRVDYPQTPKDANLIADQCGQIRAFRDSNGNVPEPVWYSGLGVLVLCNDGEAVARDWSSGHPNYSAEATTAKLERSRDFAPSTCQRFRDVNPEGCVGCKFAGKITSPIQLGEYLTPLDAESVDEVNTSLERVDRIVKNDHIGGILMPKGYKLGREGVYFLITDDNNPPERKWIFEHQPVWVSGFAVDSDVENSEVEVSWVDANGKEQKAGMPFDTTATDNTLEVWLKRRGIYGTGNIKLKKAYFDAAISKYARERKAVEVFNRFGLHDGGFVVGTSLVTADGSSPTKLSMSKVSAETIRQVQPTGSLSAWSEASRLWDRPEWWMHRFTVMGALASPCYAFTKYQGSILSLAGESSGGKTTAANFGVSAFGHPDAFTFSPEDTLNALYYQWERAGNLPLIVNEADQISPLLLKKVIYAAANGEGRGTLTRTRQLNHKGRWSLLTIFTLNTSLLSLPTSLLQDAQRCRILEFQVNVENKMSPSVGKELSDTAKGNVGHAGRAFVEYLMKRPTDVVTLIDAKFRELELDVDPRYRFALWQIATNSIVGQMAKSLGIIHFEVDDAIANAYRTVKNLSAVELDPIERVERCLADYTTEYQDSIGQFAIKSKTWIEPPRGRARGKQVIGNDNISPTETYIATDAFREYARDRGIGDSYIDQWRKARSIEKRKTVIAPSANSVQCYVVPAEEVAE